MEQQEENLATNVDNNTNHFSNTRLTVAAVFAFLPSFGIFGIHDFILKQYKKGLTHILLVVAFCASLFLVLILCKNDDNCFYSSLISNFLIHLAISSYVWAVVEGVQIIKSMKQDTPLKPEVIGEDKAIVETNQNKKQDRKVWSILSIIATSMPIFLWLFCLIVSGGNTSENGSGGVWWLMIMYYWSIGIPLAILSIVFGIIGLTTSLRRLAAISLMLKIATIIAIFMFLIIH